MTRLPILLAEIKAGNNSYKLKNEIWKMLHLLYQLKKITKKVYNNLIMSFYFDFNWPKDFDDNLKHEIDFIIKSNEYLAENKIKS